jgi:hypothetical protein
MDGKPEDRADRAARREAMKQVGTCGTKKRNAATHGGAGREKKARKTAPSTSLALSGPSTPPPREDVSIDTTPLTSRQASYSALMEHEVIYALEMQNQISAEVRGVTRRNIPWDKFYSMYLDNFSMTTQPELVESVKKVGEDSWEEKLFWKRLRQSLSDEVRYLGCLFILLSVLC